MSVRLSEAEYRTLVDHSPVLIWRAGLDAKCDYFNETWLEFTGRSHAQELGDGWAEGVHPEDLQRCVAYYLDHFQRRQSFEMEYRLRRHDGVFRWILDRGAPFLDADGQFSGFIGSCIDIEDRRRAQDERDQRDRKAIAGAQEFEQWILGIVGHDIRNPLSAIDQATQLLQRAHGDPSAFQRNIDRIRRGVDRIGHMVNDLLDMTRARHGGGIPIAKRPSDLHVICREVIDECATGAAGRDVSLRASGDATGTWDPHRLAQAIGNLVGNALKHSPSGTPVRVTIAGASAEVVVEVHNQGEIAAEALPTLFDPFRGTTRDTRPDAGLGLGLFIANAIARAHQGAIDVASSHGGTVFRLRLPR